MAVINGAVNSFVLSATQELKSDIRINAVSPRLVEDSFDRYGHLFQGFNLVPMTKVVNAYLLSIEGAVKRRNIKGVFINALLAMEGQGNSKKPKTL